jgi:protein phosphatase
VAIFKGVQADVPGVSLNHVAEDTDITVEALPDYQTEQLADGIPADSLAAARGIVARLTRAARTCPEPASLTDPEPSGGASPGTSTGTPSGAPAPSPSPDRTATAAPSPTPSSTPSPTLAPPDCIEATP